MKTQRSLWKLSIAVLIVLMVACTLPGSIARADNPSDGRINQVTWVNSWGAVAVYCIGNSGNPSDTFVGGGIKILNQNGERQLWATEQQINAAFNEVFLTKHSVLITTGSVYSLYALPGGQFQLNSLPDVQGKVRLAVWQGCQKVVYPTNAPTQTPPPVVVPL